MVDFIIEFVGNLLGNLLHNNNHENAEHENAKHEKLGGEHVKEQQPVSPEEALVLLSSMNTKRAAPPVEQQQEQQKMAEAPEEPNTTRRTSARDDKVQSTTSSLSDVGEQRQQQSSDTQLSLQREKIMIRRSVVAMAKTNNPHKSSLPLSMRLIHHVSGIALYCQDCAVVPPTLSSFSTTPSPVPPLSSNKNDGDFVVMTTTSNSNSNYNDEQPEEDPMAAAHWSTSTSFDYDLQALQRQQQHSATMATTASRPLLQLSQLQYPHHSTMERILTEYMAACRFYGCGDRINAGVLTTLRFSLPALRVSADFYNADMLALCEVLLHHANGALRYIRRLDFSLSGLESSSSSSPQGQGRNAQAGGLTSHGALTLSKVLHVTRYIQEVDLRRNNIGPFGASAIFLACFENPYSGVCKINMRRCRVGERGALVLAELLSRHQRHDNMIDDKNKSSTTTTPTSSEVHLLRPLTLREIDLSSNYIGVQGCVEVERALRQRAARGHHEQISINLEGNLVFSEIINGVTHGLGSLLSLVAVYAMHQRVKDKDLFHVLSCSVYSASLVILYISSTLYHSFFSMQQTKYIFQALDKCAIYILIAGTYTPYLVIMMMPERPDFTIAMLAVLWSGCVLGISVEAFWKEWAWRPTFSLAMYLGMGWSALAGYSVLAPIIPTPCLHLIFAGGVTYTLGVPFFVRDGSSGYLDHAIWHMFVLAASIFHWLSIYMYVANWPAEFVEGNDETTTTLSSAMATTMATLVPSSCPSGAGIISSSTLAAHPVLEMLLTQA